MVIIREPGVARLVVMLMQTVANYVCRDVWCCCSRRLLGKKVVAECMCWLGTVGGRCLHDVLARVLCLSIGSAGGEGKVWKVQSRTL
jgi:hypothetical protein